jgi:hypothetical protein
MDRHIFNKAGQPIKCPDRKKWKEFMADDPNDDLAQTHTTVKITTFKCARKQPSEVTVMTIFLGYADKPLHLLPNFWETKIFGGKLDWIEPSYRCGGNKEQAEAMHDKIVTLAKLVERTDSL